MKNQNTLFNKLFLLLAFAIFLFPFASAVGLNSGTILNATVSNTTATFNAFNITVDSFTVDSRNITLINILCSNGITQSSIFLNTPNSNTDSAVYCASGSSSTNTTNLQNLNNACSQTKTSFNSIIVIIGLILTIVLIATVIGLLLNSFGILPQMGGDGDGGGDLKGILIAVGSVAVLGILVIAIIYMFESGICPAFGA